MKPTKNQKAVLDAVITQLSYWKNTNDIDSPTHLSDLHDEIFSSVGECLSQKELYDLEVILIDLLSSIRELAI